MDSKAYLSSKWKKQSPFKEKIVEIINYEEQKEKKNLKKVNRATEHYEVDQYIYCGSPRKKKGEREKEIIFEK